MLSILSRLRSLPTSRLMVAGLLVAGLLVAGARSAPAVAAGAAPLPVPLANPGFEGTYSPLGECVNITGEVASGWNDNTCWDGAAPVIRYARDTVNPHSGLASQKITLDRGTRVQLAQFLAQPFEPNMRYTVSVWMRSDTAMDITVALRQGPAPYAGYASKLVVLTPARTQYTFDAVTPSATGGLFVVTTTPGRSGSTTHHS